MLKKRPIKVFALVIVFSMLLSLMGNSLAFAYDKNDIIFVVPNSHIDTAWGWPVEETARDIIPDTYNRALNALRYSPNYKFSTSASQHYQYAKEYYPEMYEEIKEFVNKGQWNIVGGQVVEPDLNLSGGEALVRQSLHAQKFFRDEFGKPSKTGFVPDVFGFSAQMPQIMKKSGMENFVTTKLNWNDTNKLPTDIWWWQALDGSRVLFYKPMKDYTAQSISPSEANSILDRIKDAGVNKGLLLYGSGDHGGGPNLTGSQNSYQAIERYNQDPAYEPTIKISTVDEYFENVRQDDLSKVPVWEGEFYFEYHRGTYTSWARIKEGNRKSEILAEEAEKVDTLGKYLGVLEGSPDKIKTAWDKILVNQMHDILPGSSVPYQYDVTINQYELVKNILSEVKNYGLQAIAYKADTRTDEGVPVFVFNPLSWERSEFVETNLDFEDDIENIRMFDDEGNELPVTILRKNGNSATVRFMAKNVPSIGFKVYKAVNASEPSDVQTTLSVVENDNEYILENDFYKVVINLETGNIAHIYNKKDGNRDILNGEGNELHIYTDTGGSSWPAWDVVASELNKEPTYVLNDTPDSIEIIENTPTKAVIRVKRNWSNSTFIQDITMYPDVDRIDVKMAVDWYETDRLLKVSFPISAIAYQATYETSYGSVERPTTRDDAYGRARFEVPGHKWADVTNEADKAFGMSLLNDSKYGWDALLLKDANGNPTSTRLRLTLLRSARTHSSGSEWQPTSQRQVDQGHYEFTYSIYPHKGDWAEANTVRKAYELNYPMTAFQTDKHQGALGKNYSFISIDAPNTIITVVKGVWDEPNSKDLILRMYEAHGKDKTTATITLPNKVKSAIEVNLLEEPMQEAKAPKISANNVTVDFGKYEIKTLRVSLNEFEDQKVEQKIAPVELYTYYNFDGVSSNDNRADGDLDGKGNTYPAELWPTKIIWQGIPFVLGPTKDGYNNLVQAKGQTIKLPEGKYKYVYLIGAASGDDPSVGKFTVTYKDNNVTEKEISFANWYAKLSGWDRFSRTFAKPKITDTVAYVFTHYHMPNADRMTEENFLYLYNIELDVTKDVKEITLPDAPGIKIAAITLADSDFLRVAKLDKEIYKDSEPPTKVQNVIAKFVEGSMNQVEITWDEATDNDKVLCYEIYRGLDPDFTPNRANYLATVSTTMYIDELSYMGKFYYKVIAVDSASNTSEPSEASNGIEFKMTNIALRPENVATANGYMAAEPPWKAIDGTVLNNSKWCYNGGSNNASESNPYWLKIDFGSVQDNITAFVVKHAGAGGESTSWNTRDFKIQISNNDVDWQDVVVVTGNTQNVTQHLLDEKVSARYVRLRITHPGQRNCARIYEFEIWSEVDELVVEPAVENVYIDTVVKDNDQLIITPKYTFKPWDPNAVEMGSIYKWYGKKANEDSFVEIEGENKKVLTLSYPSEYEAVIFEVTPVDNYGNRGKAAKSDPVFIGLDTVVDRAYKRPATANNWNSNEEPWMAVDGDYSTKWCYRGNDPHFLIIDMGGLYSLTEFEIRHAESRGELDPNHFDNNPALNTRDFEIALSYDGINWKEPIIVVEGNSAPITTHVVDSDVDPDLTIGRYVRLKVNKSVDTEETYECVRIYEFRAFGTPKYDHEYVPELPGEEPTDVKAKDVQIEGTPEVYKVLTGTYTLEEQYEKFCKFRWLELDDKYGIWVPIPNANGKTFVPTQEFEGKYVRFEVRVGLGEPVTSDSVLIAPESEVNVLIGSNITANNETVGHEVDKVLDEDDSTYWFTEGDNNSIIAVLDAVYKINRFVVKHAATIPEFKNATELNTKDFEILVSTNGIDWVVVERITSNPYDMNIIELDTPVLAKYIKLQINKSYYQELPGITPGTRISEFAAYGTLARASTPEILSVSIPERAETGAILVAEYRYYDPEGAWEGNSILQWMVFDEELGYIPIPGATSKFLKVTKDLTGKLIKFTVIPVNKYGNMGSRASSNAVLVENALPRIQDIVIEGDNTREGKLIVNYKYLDYEDDPEGETQFQWYVSQDGLNYSPIEGATTSKLIISDYPMLVPGRSTVKCRVTPYQDDGREGYAADSKPVPIVPEGYNVIRGKTVIAYSSYVNENEAPGKLIDGDYTTKWCDNTSRNPKYVTIDLQKTYTIHTFVLRNCQSWEPGYPNARNYQIQVSLDGETWTDAYSTTNGGVNINVIELAEPVRARYINFRINESGTARIYELEAWGIVDGTILETDKNEVTIGELFTVTYGVSVTDEVYKQDIEINYDPDIFSFDEDMITILDDDIVMKSVYDDGEGNIKISLENETGEILGNADILSLSFTAKNIRESEVESAISITKALFTTISGYIIEAECAKVNIKVVKPIVDTKPFKLVTDGELDRSIGIKARVRVELTDIEHDGNEVVVLQLMKGTEPITIAAIEKDILASEEFIVHFSVTDPDNNEYKVKAFIFDRYDNGDTAPISLAEPVELR